MQHHTQLSTWNLYVYTNQTDIASHLTKMISRKHSCKTNMDNGGHTSSSLITLLWLKWVTVISITKSFVSFDFYNLCHTRLYYSDCLVQIIGHFNAHSAPQLSTIQYKDNIRCLKTAGKPGDCYSLKPCHLTKWFIQMIIGSNLLQLKQRKEKRKHEQKVMWSLKLMM